MKPGFALSLSLEGIALLHRAVDGWRVVGEVSLDAPDLALVLETLRQRAIEIDPRGPLCKLIIPNDQIRYLDVPATGPDDDANRDLALAALAKATPYTLQELAYDLKIGAERTQVAALAHATLAEAEHFATEHGFEPVSFVAIPEDGTFDGEPFFGEAGGLPAGASLERDEHPVSIVGPFIDPAPQDPVETSDADAPAAPEDLPDDPVPFVSRRGQGDEPSSAPRLAGASRGEPAASVADATGDEKPKPAPVVTDPVTPADTVPRPAGDRPSKPVIIRPTQEVAPQVSVPASPQSAIPAPKVTEPERAPEPVPQPKNEAERLTVFGDRDKTAVGGKPRHLGLILMAVLLLFLAGVAAWAALFLDDGIAGLFDRGSEAEEAIVSVPTTPDARTHAPSDPAVEAPGDGRADETAGIEPDAVAPVTPSQDAPLAAATDQRQSAPVAPATPETDDLNDLYEVSIDRTDLAQDALALPAIATLDTDQPLDAVAAPAAAGTTFTLGDDGLVIPTPEGALSPEGIRVYLGKPPVVPPAPPTRFEAEPDLDAGRDRLAQLRPKSRPSDLAEQTERAQLGGLTRSELGKVRPKTRPRTQKQEAERDETPTALAVVLSRTPKVRPRNFSTKVETVRKQTAGPSTQVAAATVAPQTVTPPIPSSASVARRATLDNAINLRRINLIGVYGTPSNRRALIRLPSGRYQKVKVGDRVDGGKIVAIGDSELRYQKSGRNVTLTMPRG
ncbi:hypothetical protein AB9K34_20135 [Sedimentitalea sp. XS_ASV28]|uniref:hypothetical protein n=1 Tax=Sedimentitalea sp. XS_ASV28 TaxID=3241296 RepID=UPI003515FDC8